MLQLKGISKIYKIGNNEIKALDNINLSFVSGEFVSILGPSGCGKTTLLNIIGGLDQYTSGDLIIKGKSTKDFNSPDWDAYRNNSVGFVFQNYNLINHISILENVEMGLTLSGVSFSERRKRAIEVLNRVGLKDQMYKKSHQLSGGQKQRVAIARALANDPEIILADEPTGALDTKTAKQIMDLIKEISKEKLVIMVTHNGEIAHQYSTRIVKLLDGSVINDSKPVINDGFITDYKIKKTQMNFSTALNLSFNNLKTKIKRTLITAFAGSIGIIGIALVLALGNGFKANINNLETSTLSSLPISISKNNYNLNFGPPPRYREEKNVKNNENFNLYDESKNVAHKNIITNDYLVYLKKLDKSSYSTIEYIYGLRDVLLYKSETINKIRISTFDWNQLAYDDNFIKENFELVAGEMPSGVNNLTVIIDKNNRISTTTLQSLGIDISKDVKFTDVLNKEIVFPYNKDLYVKSYDYYTENSDLTNAYNNGVKLTITSVIRVKNNTSFNTDFGIYYRQGLKELIINDNIGSDICLKQKELNYNVLTKDVFFDEDLKNNALSSLGCDNLPIGIKIYPSNYQAKETIKAFLDLYNKDMLDVNKILYSDLAETIGNTLGKIISMISTVLVAFAAISLIVSSIMIGIITYVSVLERTKEIGILRSLGARKKDIARVFNAEAIIIGFVAGIMGILITFILTFPINAILKNINNQFNNVARMNLFQSLLLVIVSICLTFIAGIIPALIAANKHPVEALRHNE